MNEFWILTGLGFLVGVILVVAGYMVLKPKKPQKDLELYPTLPIIKKPLKDEKINDVKEEV